MLKPRCTEVAEFSGAASSDTEAPIAHYLWDLDGDGTFETDTGSAPTAVRSYSAAGTLTPRLRVVDANGETSDAATSVTVVKRPPSAACPRFRARVAHRRAARPRGDARRCRASHRTS